LVNKVKEDEASFKAQVEIQKNEIEDLWKQLAEAKEKCGLAEANQDISEYWKNYIQLKNFARPKKDVLKNHWAAWKR
jgi:septal ring factor EnvC (AmiA/AmiB activator)